MKNKLVLWGSNAQEERILLALELRPDDNKVDIITFPEPVATEEFSQKLLNEWRNGQPVEFPEDHTKIERELSVSESLLPDDLKVERGDIVQRAQTEWQFIVLSSKLNEVYQSEMGELRDRVDKLEKYDSDVWESLKGFWNKVQEQVRDRNLFRDHADSLRDNTNALFSRMKELRSKMDDEFQSLSKDNLEKFMGKLEDVEDRISKGLRLQPLFEELKGLQRKFRNSKLTRDHRSKVWERLDSAFKSVKEKRFGPGAATERSPMDRLKRRFDGLITAIEKMERSIQRDRNDLDFQKRKIASTDGQLEAQIRQAKIKMIEERIRSKEEKLGEMLLTRQELEKKMELQKDKDAKRAEREKLAEAKRLAQKKIAEEIKQKAAKMEEESNKLEKAAEAIHEFQHPKKEKEKDSGLLDNIGFVLSETMEDVIDTIKAVAEVVGDKLEDAVEDIKEKLTDEEEKEVVVEQQEGKVEEKEETDKAETEEIPLQKEASSVSEEEE